MGKALTVAAIEKAKPGPARREIPDGMIPGLYLVVQPSGVKSFAVRYRAGGRPKKLTLSPRYPALTLAQARERAREALMKVATGEDPAAERQQPKRDDDLFEHVLADFLKRHASRNRSGADVARSFEREVLPHWRGRRIDKITRRDVIALIDGIADSGRGVTANRVLAHVSKLFNWCLERDIIPASPVAGVKPPAREVPRERILADEELRLLWRACDAIGEPFGPLVKLLVLTGARRGEVAGMTAAELHLEDDHPHWIIPAARAKNNREHVLPLPAAAVEIIAGVRRIAGAAGYVFSTSGVSPVSGFTRAHERLHREMCKIGERDIPAWTFHDLRRTAASGMARLGIAPHVVEAVLNHKSGTIRGVAAVYNRHGYQVEQQAALEAWGRYVSDLVTCAPANNIVALRG